mgnify:CR=1 FL=1
MARILISMKDNFLKTIDELATKEQRTRSEFVREALRDYIKKSSRVMPKNAEKNASVLEGLME